MKNDFEEAFLKRYAVLTSKQGQAPTPSEPCCLLMRNCRHPMQRVEWCSDGDVRNVGPASGELRRAVASRTATWHIELTFPSSSAAASPLVEVLHNGARVQDPSGRTVLSAGDIVQFGGSEADGSSDGLWRVEWGPSFTVTCNEATEMPKVLSYSPYVVGESAANQEIFDMVHNKVHLVSTHLQDVIGAAGASDVIAPFSLTATDPPQVSLNHRLDWLCSGLHQLDSFLRVKPSVAGKETQTTSSLLGANPGLWGAANCQRTCPGESFAPRPSQPDSDVTTNGMMASLEHQLWVARQQLQSVMRGDVARTMEMLLHRNAELERRLAQREVTFSEMEDELAVLRRAVSVDHGKRLVAVEQLEQLLHRRCTAMCDTNAVAPCATPDASQDPSRAPSTQTPPIQPLTIAQERNVWSAVSELLLFVETADCMAEAARLQLAHKGKCSKDGGHQISQTNEELRAEIASLRAEGGVEVVASLQATVGDLAARLGAVGHSAMSAWR